MYLDYKYVTKIWRTTQRKIRTNFSISIFYLETLYKIVDPVYFLPKKYSLLDITYVSHRCLVVSFT
jgi:hypothetical protein